METAHEKLRRESEDLKTRDKLLMKKVEKYEKDSKRKRQEIKTLEDQCNQLV